jgi:hypothetical protein
MFNAATDIIAPALKELAAAASEFAIDNNKCVALFKAARIYHEAVAKKNGVDLIRDRIDRWLAATRNIDNPTSCKGRVASDAIAILLENAGLFRMAGRMRDLLNLVRNAGTRIMTDQEIEQMNTVVALVEEFKSHAEPRVQS